MFNLGNNLTTQVVCWIRGYFPWSQFTTTSKKNPKPNIEAKRTTKIHEKRRFLAHVKSNWLPLDPYPFHPAWTMTRRMGNSGRSICIPLTFYVAFTRAGTSDVIWHQHDEGVHKWDLKRGLIRWIVDHVEAATWQNDSDRGCVFSDPVGAPGLFLWFGSCSCDSLAWEMSP